MKKSKGFTLIELLIVLAILAILFAIGFSNCMIYRERRAQTQQLQIITQQQEAEIDKKIEKQKIETQEKAGNKL